MARTVVAEIIEECLKQGLLITRAQKRGISLIRGSESDRG